MIFIACVMYTYIYSTLKANSVLPAGVSCTTLFCYYAEQVMASKIDVIISEQKPNSSLERASTLVSSEIPPIYKWLLYVMITTNIAPREITLLKLCLHQTLVRDTSEASTASDLFHAMDGSDDLEQQQAVLYIQVYLCPKGHRLQAQGRRVHSSTEEDGN